MDTKSVYSTKADKYARYRWDYAPRAIEIILERTQLNEQSGLADLGAGTGILTRHFAAKVHTLYAVEPNPELRQILTAAMSAFPAVTVLDGCAEDTHLPDNSVDVITVAQAIHWFDPQPARQGMLRILKQNGWLVLLKNSGVNSEKDQAVRQLMTEPYGADFSIVTERPKEQPARFYFGHDDYQTFVFPFAFQQKWAAFMGSLTSASFMPDENHPLYPKLEAAAKQVFAQFSEDGFWTVEGETELIIGRLS